MPDRLHIEKARFIKKAKPKGIGLDRWRTICWASVVCSGYSTLIQRRTSTAIEPELEDFTTGCRPGVGTVDCIAALYAVLTQRHIDNKHTVVQALDQSKAYDSIQPELASGELARIIGWGNLCAAAHKLISDRPVAVTWNGMMYSTLRTKRGVPQGSGISTVFPAILLNPLNRHLKASGLGVVVGGIAFASISYAEDIALIAANPHNALAQHRRVLAFLTKRGMSLNSDKHVIMLFAPGPSTQVQSELRTLRYHFRDAQIQPSVMRYLGAYFRPYTRKWNTHYAIRMKTGIALANRAKERGIFVGVATPIAHRILYLSFIRPAMSFACEVAIVRQDIVDHMARVQRGVLAAALTLPVTSHGAVLNVLFGTPPMDFWTRAQFLKWWCVGMTTEITEPPEPCPLRGRQRVLHQDARFALDKCSFHTGARLNAGHLLRFTYLAYAVEIFDTVDQGTPIAAAAHELLAADASTRTAATLHFSLLVSQAQRALKQHAMDALQQQVASSHAPLRFWLLSTLRRLRREWHNFDRRYADKAAWLDESDNDETPEGEYHRRAKYPAFPNLILLLLPFEWYASEVTITRYRVFWSLLFGNTQWHWTMRQREPGERLCPLCHADMSSHALHLLYSCPIPADARPDFDEIPYLNAAGTDFNPHLRLPVGDVVPGFTARQLWDFAGRLAQFGPKLWDFGADTSFVPENFLFSDDLNTAETSDSVETLLRSLHETPIEAAFTLPEFRTAPVTTVESALTDLFST